MTRRRKQSLAAVSAVVVLILAALVLWRPWATPVARADEPGGGQPAALPYKPVVPGVPALNPEASGVPYEQLSPASRAAIDEGHAAAEARWPADHAAAQTYAQGMKARAAQQRAERAAGIEVLP